MSNNPTATLAPKTSIQFCLAVNAKDKNLVCTRIDHHDGHCCDEVARKGWADSGKTHVCKQDYDHSAEKGLLRR